MSMTFLQDGSATYHCHTHWSDGQSDAAAMVAAAQAAGLREIGFSDHLVLPPSRIDIPWAMDPARLDDYVCEVRGAAQTARIPVRLGLEVDFFPENPRQAELDDLLSRHSFDYAIGSIHLLNEFALDSAADDWARLSPSEVDAVFVRYWQEMRQLAETPGFDILGHLDLPKKFGFQPETDIREVENAALDAVARSGKLVELNTAGWDKLCAECYPAPDLLRRCLARDIPIIINDDAHAPDQVARHYERARKLLESVSDRTRET